MPSVIDISRDIDGLRTQLPRYFRDPLSVPFGYRKHIEHLARIDSLRGCAIEITADEAWGVDSAEGSIPRHPGDKTAASYLNFLIVNGGVILPAFGDPNDPVAKATLEGLFPDREVVTVPGREIVLGGGNVHCISQQQPRG